MALAVSGTDLYAGGQFTTAGGVPANYIAKWDGSAWSALGSGIERYSLCRVTALAADGAGHLFVGGNFLLAGTNVSPYIAQANVGSILAPAGFDVARHGHLRQQRHAQRHGQPERLAHHRLVPVGRHHQLRQPHLGDRPGQRDHRLASLRPTGRVNPRCHLSLPRCGNERLRTGLRQRPELHHGSLPTEFNYTTNNGTITITGYTGPGGAVTIPSTINGLPVTSIGDRCVLIAAPA